MKKIRELITLERVYHALSVSVILYLCYYGWRYCSFSLVRLFSSIRDLIMAVGYTLTLRLPLMPDGKYMFCYIYDPPSVMFADVLPFNVDEIDLFFKLYFGNMFSWSGFSGYSTSVFKGARGFIIASILIFLAFKYIIVKLWKWRVFSEGAESSKWMLLLFGFLRFKVFRPIKAFIAGYVDFLKKENEGNYVKIWLALALLDIGVLGFAFEVLAFLIYYLGAFNVYGFQNLLYKWLIDITLITTSAPVWVWCIVLLVLFLRWRSKKALDRLNHMEAKNKGLLNSCGCMVILNAPPGGGKTTTAVGMTLSAQEIFKEKQLTFQYEIWLKFPDFPFSEFEKDFWFYRKLPRSDERCVFNNPTARAWVHNTFKRHFLSEAEVTLWGYDLKTYASTFDAGKDIETLEWNLGEYACLYLMYTRTFSEIVANISVRSDCVFDSKGHFPVWNMDMFDKDVAERKRRSQYSCILDKDIMRPGVKMDPDNPLAGSFEYGIIFETEAGKEYGNKVTNERYKKAAEGESTPFNDLHATWAKMQRHPSTVCYYPFVLELFDEQRSSSLELDMLEMCTRLYIAEVDKKHIALPFFTLERAFCEWLLGKFKKLKVKYRYKVDSSKCVSMQLFTQLVGLVFNYYTKMFGRYGYDIRHMNMHRGDPQDEEFKKVKWFGLWMKELSDRFCTDAYREPFADAALASGYSIDDYPTYKSVRPTSEEYELQHSRFANTILKTIGKQGENDENSDL